MHRVYMYMYIYIYIYIYMNVFYIEFIHDLKEDPAKQKLVY